MRNLLAFNTLVYICSGFVNQASLFLFWIFVSRAIPPSDIGLYALIVFIIEFFGAFAVFGLDSAITRFYYTDNKIESVLTSSCLIFLIACLVTSLLFFLLADFIFIIIPELRPFFESHSLLILSIVIASSFANLILVHYSSLKKSLMYAILLLLRTASFCLASAILVKIGWGLEGVVCSLLISAVAVILVYAVKERNLIVPDSVSGAAVWELLAYGSPLMAYSLFAVVVTYFGRVMLNNVADLATLGIYNLFFMITLQINGVWSSFNRAWTPTMFDNFLQNREGAVDDIRSFIFKSSIIYLAVLMLFVFLGELFFFKYLFKPEYLEKIPLFYVLLTAPIFSGIYTATYPLFYYEKRTIRILVISSLISCLTIIISALLISKFSQTGAAVSYLLSSILAPILYFMGFRKHIALPDGVIFLTYLLSALMILSAMVLIKTCVHSFLLVLLLALAFAVHISGMHFKDLLSLKKI